MWYNRCSRPTGVVGGGVDRSLTLPHLSILAPSDRLGLTFVQGSVDKPRHGWRSCVRCRQLLKFTSLIKGGFLPRWFHLDPVSGIVTYYLTHEALKKKQARGTINLLGAVVSLSDEDSQTFAIHATSGEITRLKAADAKELQLWVSRLRHCVERLASGSRSRCATAPSQSTSGIRPAPSVISRDAPGSDRLIQSTTTNLSPSSSLRETSPLRSGPSASSLRVRRGVPAQTSTVSVQSMYPSGLNEDSSIRSIQQTYNLTYNFLFTGVGVV